MSCSVLNFKQKIKTLQKGSREVEGNCMWEIVELVSTYQMRFTEQVSWLYIHRMRRVRLGIEFLPNLKLCFLVPLLLPTWSHPILKIFSFPLFVDSFLIKLKQQFLTLAVHCHHLGCLEYSWPLNPWVLLGAQFLLDALNCWDYKQ